MLDLIQHRRAPTVIEYLITSTRAIESRDMAGRNAMDYLDRFDSDNTRLRNLLQGQGATASGIGW
ncbi:MAG: hypothetical protein FWB78_05295 [Treponema sp.]|nr:hypothetical protein [Treponema sp.]